MNAADVAVATVLGAAALRGLWIGLVREVASLAALAVAVVAVRMFYEPLGAEIAARTELSPLAANVAAGAALAIGSIALVAIAGRILGRGLQAAGLGWADRLGGGVLGAAEGLLIAALLVVVASWAIGREDPLLAESKSVEAFERLEIWAAQSGSLPDVAAGPKSSAN